MSNLSEIRSNGIEIKLNGQPYRIIFDLNAMAEVEEKYGSVGKAVIAMQQGSFKAIRCVLWAMLLHDNPELTEKEVGSMVTVGNLDEIVEHITAAVNKDTPSEEERSESAAPASNPT